MSSNKNAKNKLIELYGAECFIEKLNLRPKATKGKYTSKAQMQKMRQLTFHHIHEKRNGGRSTVENRSVIKCRKSRLV